jgi:zinc protease
LWLFLTLPSGGDLQQAQAAFDAEIDRIRTNGVTAAELSKARNQALADFWRGLATINGKAELLGSYAVLRGGYQKLFDAPRSYEQVTAEDVKKIAAEILRPSNRTVGVLAAAAEDKEVK